MIVVVGGHSRNIGKTSVMAGIIAATPELEWTAIKITQYGNGVCATVGEHCGCAVEYDHPYALHEERDRGSETDSGRYLAAGAVKSWWLRTATGQLGNALPAIRRICGEARNCIMESNSVLQFLKPDLYVVVLDFAVMDFKATSLRYLDRADALAIVERDVKNPAWEGVAERLWAGKRKIYVKPDDYLSPEFRDLISTAVIRRTGSLPA